MPIRPLPTAKFHPDDGTLWVDIAYPETQLFCRYLLQLRQVDSNTLVPEYDSIRGDNENSADDSYDLPTPSRDNDGRVLMIFHTIMDQTGDGGLYRIRVTVRQAGKETTEETEISGEQDMKQTILKFEIEES
jgi:hypothetical protein